jgi:hypothetical protein
VTPQIFHENYLVRKYIFLVRKYIIHFEYKDKKPYKKISIQNIFQDNNLLLFTFNIRIKNLYLGSTSKILLGVLQLVHF